MPQCVITGHRNGRAVFVKEGSPAEVVSFAKTPDMAMSRIFASSGRPGVGGDKIAWDEGNIPFLPAVGETRFCILTIPPDSVMSQPGFDLAGALKEFAELQPEMAALREAADPAMHRTNTIDHIIILDGEVWLELDDRQEVHLRQHDVVVQDGTRHAWRNRSDRPVTMAVVMLGAERLG